MRRKVLARVFFYPVVVVATLSTVVMIAGGGSQRRADFTFINRGTIMTMDPAAMSWMQDIRLALSVYQGLYTYDPKTTAPIPGSALPAEIGPDRRTYTFYIRPEARWSNGDPLTAGDFVYAWRRALEPGTAADYSFFFDLIDGVKTYCQWRQDEIKRIGAIADRTARLAARDGHLAEADRRFGQTVGITAVDDKTLRVKLVRPVAYFLDLCAFSVFLPLHRASIEPFKVLGDDGLIYYDEQWVKPEHCVYNGPFVIADWKFKRYVNLEKNPYYWDRTGVTLNSIEMIEVDDANTSWMLYDTGRVDWLSSLDAAFTPDLIARSHSPFQLAINKTGTQRDDIHCFPAFGTYYYNFNCKDKLPDGRDNPFRDPRVRQAFTMAVDKQQLVDQVVRLGNPVATSFVPPGSIPGYPSVAGLPLDPPRARALLAEAGYPGGKGFPEVAILYNTGADHGNIAQAILTMWERELGVRGRCDAKEVKTFGQDKRHTNFMVCRAGWYGDYGDPTTFLQMFQTGNGNNDSAYSDAKYDRMLDDAETVVSPAQRLGKLAEAERYLVNQGLPLLPLYRYVNVYAFDPHRVERLYLNPRLMTMLQVVQVHRSKGAG